MDRPPKKTETGPRTKGQPGFRVRKPYHAPELKQYGDLASVTLGASGKPEDGLALGSGPV
jgi:hypothetical protein